MVSRESHNAMLSSGDPAVFATARTKKAPAKNPPCTCRHATVMHDIDGCTDEKLRGGAWVRCPCKHTANAKELCKVHKALAFAQIPRKAGR